MFFHPELIVSKNCLSQTNHAISISAAVAKSAFQVYEEESIEIECVSVSKGNQRKTSQIVCTISTISFKVDFFDRRGKRCWVCKIEEEFLQLTRIFML